jgi:hypothetical protein
VIDPRLAHTLEEAARNGDGSWNGVRALSWLSKALDPNGTGLSVAEIKEAMASAEAEHLRGGKL